MSEFLHLVPFLCAALPVSCASDYVGVTFIVSELYIPDTFFLVPRYLCRVCWISLLRRYHVSFVVSVF